ncbi:hypothetical protein FJZ19_01280 [Candidatus Pacearchaeota archaeon]|nr:hypothetical protein [Candidatus Pacearchaeota archaeon]
MITNDELDELLEKLGKIRGRHTELVTVLIPAGANIYTIADQIAAEQSTADNIKSKTVRKNVMDALEMISRELKKYKKTPDNGMAIFCGNVSEKEGQNDIQLWIIEPPQPLKTRLYRCDQVFVISPLQEMREVQEVYGLLVMDRREATIGLLEGKNIKVIRKMSSGVPGKIRAGGQCLSPDTLIETKNGNIKIKDVKIGDEIKSLNIENNKIIFSKCLNKWTKNKSEYLQIITKNNSIISSAEHLFFLWDNNSLIEVQADWIKKNAILLNNNLEAEKVKKIINKKQEIELIDIETEAENFFANGILVHNSSQRFERITEGLAKEFFKRVADSMKEIFFDMPKLKGILVGGPIPTKEEFLQKGELVTKLKDMVIGIKNLGNTDESGLEELVELSHDILSQQEIIKEKKILEKFFETLGKNPDKAVYKIDDVKKALKYGAVSLLILSKKLDKKTARELRNEAENISSEVEMISTETEEGEQFWNLGGIGALLRFKV